MRSLGVDPGGRRIGLAVADDASGVVTPLTVVAIDRAADAVRAVVAAARANRVDRVVVGLPVAADGSRTPACARSERLAEALEAEGIPAVLYPEHLTTDEARRRARATGLRPGRPVDHLAAAVLLEDFLGWG